eukprot:GHVO01042332.1.p1 GENE.GHVO01042332.1~~GHVO01042332.1.p1  ORF type:complete len:454 (+),score=42.53 GHVO01042332.1:25-1362(+)
MDIATNRPLCGDMEWYAEAVKRHARQLEGEELPFRGALWDFHPNMKAINGIGDRMIGIMVFFYNTMLSSRTFLLNTEDPRIQDVLWPKDIQWNVTDVEGMDNAAEYNDSIYSYIHTDLPHEKLRHIDWKSRDQDDLILYDGSSKDMNRDATPSGLRFRYFHYPKPPVMLRNARRGWKEELPRDVAKFYHSFMTLPQPHLYGCCFHTLFTPSDETLLYIGESLFDVAHQSGLLDADVDIDNAFNMDSLRNFFATRYGIQGSTFPRMEDALHAAFPQICRSDVPHFISLHIRTANAKGVAFRDNTHRAPPNVFIEMIDCALAWTEAKGKETKLLLASDNGLVRRQAAARSEHVVALGITALPKHIVFSPNIDRQEVLMESFVEIIISSLCHQFIGTRSNYGRLIASLGMFEWDHILRYHGRNVGDHAPIRSDIKQCGNFYHHYASEV